ncbi:MAG: biotin--[acetyl-CoA-carboxylase] ligase [Candidatus Glassbacteria bacterium]
MSGYELEKKLLAALKANRHRYLSEDAILHEEGLADKFNGCTECAQDVERAIEILRLQGYEIDGDLDQGWHLIACPDTLNHFELEEALHTSFLGRALFTYRMIGSTNDTARLLAVNGAADGTLIVAEEQSRGRGRRGQRWHSPPGGGIYASLILRPGIEPSQAGGLGLLAALSICLGIEQFAGLKPQIKWPNDIYLDGKKLAGILCEAEWSGSELIFLVLGFGINVNVRSFPAEIRACATSLEIETGGKKIPRIELLAEIIDRLEEGYFQYLTDGFTSFLPRVQVRDYLRGRNVLIGLDNGDRLSGTARGIDEGGMLLVEVPGRERLTAVAGGHVLQC